MSRGAFSGKGGSAKYAPMTIAGGSSSLTGSSAEFFEVTAWSADLNAAIPKHASNATGGVKDGVFGVRDSSGSVEIKVHESNGVPFGPGQVVQFVLDAGNGKIPKSLGVNTITLVARIEGAPVNIAIDGDGEAVAVTYNWQGIRPWVGAGVFANLWVVE